MSSQAIILFGGGGHCKSCIDVIEANGGFTIAAIIDVKEMLHKKVLGYEITGTDEDMPRLIETCRNVLITFGHIQNGRQRADVFLHLLGMGARFPVIISPMARVSRHALIGDGTIVMHNVVVNAGADIGRNCIINTGAIVEHDVTVGDTCHISTGAILNGGTKIGEGTFFGSNSTTVQGVEIGPHSFVAAGTRVKTNQGEGTFFKG